MKFPQMFREKDGKLSSMRAVFFLWAVGVLLVWAITSVTSGSVQNVPDSIAVIIGTLAGSKAAQKFAERP